MRRIRRDLSKLSRNGDLVYTDANENRQDKKTKDEYSRKRESSSAMRYTIEPGQAKPANRRSAVRQDPEETVTYLARPGEEEPSAPATVSTFQVAGPSQEQIPLHQFVNPSFDPDTSHDHQDSTSNSSSETRCDPQPIYSNEAYEEEEQPIYENNPTEEPLYQNRGELAVLNNPERSRLQTMDISDIA